MPSPHDLLTRLDAIGVSLAATDHGLALIGLGSVGLETDRLDAYSDLDFFAIVELGYKQQFINLPTFVQGYERSPESALAILDFLADRFEINQAMAAAIREMAQG